MVGGVRTEIDQQHGRRGLSEKAGNRDHKNYQELKGSFMLRDGMSCGATWLIREISRVYLQHDCQEVQNIPCKSHVSTTCKGKIWKMNENDGKTVAK